MDKLIHVITTVVFAVAIAVMPLLIWVCRVLAGLLAFVTIVPMVLLGGTHHLGMRIAMFVALLVAAELMARALAWLAPDDSSVIT